MVEHATLVTGGAGYIGSHAVLALRDAKQGVVVIDNLSTGQRKAVGSDVLFYEGDVADIALLRSVIREFGVDAVMHFAGSVVVPESVEDPGTIRLTYHVRGCTLGKHCERYGYFLPLLWSEVVFE